MFWKKHEGDEIECVERKGCNYEFLVENFKRFDRFVDLGYNLVRVINRGERWVVSFERYFPIFTASLTSA